MLKRHLHDRIISLRSGSIGPIKLDLLRHFLLKCLYQARRARSHEYFC